MDEENGEENGAKLNDLKKKCEHDQVTYTHVEATAQILWFGPT